METTLGGNRLGSGNKQNLSFRNYERSSHDLSYLWRSTMAAGTLVPFMSKVALPGDKWHINLNCEVLTLPTIGPLFGSYKVQLDVFEIPMRLYNAKLHNNKLGVGMDMKSITLPLLELAVKYDTAVPNTYVDNEQVNASCLLKYLGISGIGHITGTGTGNQAKRNFNAVPYLAYWDIYKNYYSNKQEEIGFQIHTGSASYDASQKPTAASLYRHQGTLGGACLMPTTSQMKTGDFLVIKFGYNAVEPDITTMTGLVDGVDTTLTTMFDSYQWNSADRSYTFYDLAAANNNKYLGIPVVAHAPVGGIKNYFSVSSFNLSNIDAIRDGILQAPGQFMITGSTAAPYGPPLSKWGTTPNIQHAATFNQEGLGIKTYQSDLFNNWVNTEWIDGTGGISELTAVDVSSGEFTIDALNIASKVYDMLNRIAVSGGTYDDWLEAVYTHERVRGVESPVYCGGLIKELGFQEVVSLAATAENPLGTLAGRGSLTNKHKGGVVEITVNEPSYIMGIVSLTPRIEYSQGNDWDVDLKTFDDLHKPALDGIGFQDLLTEHLVWSDTTVNAASGAVTQTALGKQPAWINYMTAVNKCYGGFAEQNNSMFMVLNRRYEKNADGTIKDATTYIDPTKYNHIFAQTSLDSQNFWVQIAVNCTARRKMSAKIIPNL